MNKQILLLVFTLAAAFATVANATVVTFEDVNQFTITDGYGGISGWNALGFVASGAGEGVGENLFYGNEGELLFNTAPVIFEGSFYKSYAAGPVNLITSFSLYYQNQLVHTILDPRAALQLEWVASGYSGLIDKILIKGGGEGFAIDNLTYSQGVSQVPLPTASLLFLSGLGAVGLARRNKNNNVF